MNPDKLDIAALEAAERAATPGEWRVCAPVNPNRRYSIIFVDESGGAASYFSVADELKERNADLIAALRNAAPALIAAYRERDALKDALSASGIDVCYDPRTGKIDGFMRY